VSYQRGNPEVREYMRDHSEEVRKVAKLYVALKGMELTELEEFAFVLGVDVVKCRAHYKDALITAVVKVSPEKALEVLAGQGILLPGQR